MEKELWMKRCEEAFDGGLVTPRVLEDLYDRTQESSAKDPRIDAYLGRRLIEKLAAPAEVGHLAALYV